MKHKKIISKFGKSSSELLKIKKNFVNENDFYVQRQNKIAKLYSKQKKRLIYMELEIMRLKNVKVNL